MTNNSKTFRLFISSTFSDFQVERETLQTKVFPEIKEYCSIKGYTFQPIDLRWGVSDEAQEDQKALEICVKEVQSCKRHDYPNFLIMLGDRYGWVPLPNIIEKTEFEKIIQSIEGEDKEYILSWYYEDANQIPTSYILKQRTEDYKDPNKWTEVESKLRSILQVSVSQLDEGIKKKYFTSATEVEAIEGIISYFTKTPYQEKLLKLLPELNQLDHKHIFGFFRDIDKKTIIKDKFISDDCEKAQEFKEKVKKQLIDENILVVSTSQISKDNLNESYLEKFTSSVIEFLKQQVNLQITKDKEKNYSTLEIEKQQQYKYLNQKLENFLGQEKIINDIQNYINNENNKPLIICGQSGIGKSSIIAKAIEDTSNNIDKRVIYRFVGATSNSTTTTDILVSILEELEVTIENENIVNENQFLTDIGKKENSFVEFSHKVYDAVTDLKDDIVIFIDAVDQLTNDDQFIWLSNKLPLNIKIVISTLKDSNYKEDSKYFYTLEDKISSHIEIEPFNKPLELLTSLLKQQNRAIQDEQKEYFLTQYSKVNTPLYVYMAANEMQYWKSNDKINSDVALSLSQKDIVKKFIDDLTTIHHHNKLLVQKVFGYILASKDGLSEYEILELLNIDKEFIKKLAPDTWHTNTTKELPLVIWIRFYNHIKPFLSRKNQDGQELLYFFHREFIDAVQNQSNQKAEHESIIKATQKLILKYQDQEFDSNRWGKLYANLLAEHFLKYKDDDILNKMSLFITELKNDKYKQYFYSSSANVGLKYNSSFYFEKAISYLKISFNCSCYMYNKNPFNNTLDYNKELLHHAILDSLNTSEELNNDVYKILEEFVDKSSWTRAYVNSISNLSDSLIFNNQISESIKIQENGLLLIKKLYSENPYIWAKEYTKTLTSLSKVYSSIKQDQKSIELLLKCNEIIELMYQQSNLFDKNSENIWQLDYAMSLYNISKQYNSLNHFEYALIYGDKALELIKRKEYIDNIEIKPLYFMILSNSSIVNLNNSNVEYSQQLLEDNLSSLKTFYDYNPSDKNAIIYINYLNNLAVCYTNNNQHHKSIEVLQDLLIIIETLYYQNQKIWITNYTLVLANLATIYNDLNNLTEAKDYALRIMSLFEQNNKVIEKNHINALLVLSEISMKLNDLESTLKYGLQGINLIEENFNLKEINWGYIYIRIISIIGASYINNKMFNDAILYYEKALTVSINIDNVLPKSNHKQPLDALSILIKLYVSNNNFEQVIGKGQMYINFIEKVHLELPNYYSNQYLSILPIIGGSYASIDENSELYSLNNSKECLENYFDKFNIIDIKINELEQFIFTIVSYAKLLIKLNDDSIYSFISKKITFLKNKFEEEYDSKLIEINSTFKQISTLSEKHKSAYEIFVKFFIDKYDLIDNKK